MAACCKKRATLLKTPLFETVLIDVHKGSIHCVFVVISPDKVNDTASIKKIVRDLKEAYSLDHSASIAFFSHKSYANYYTELFMDDGYRWIGNISGRWLCEYYMSEYNMETGIYKTYPGCEARNKQKAYLIPLVP